MDVHSHDWYEIRDRDQSIVKATVNQLFEADKIKLVLDDFRKLNEVLRLVQYFSESKHKGKVVVDLE